MEFNELTGQPDADKSAVGAMNRPLRRTRRPRFIAGIADLSAPVDDRLILFNSIIVCRTLS